MTEFIHHVLFPLELYETGVRAWLEDNVGFDAVICNQIINQCYVYQFAHKEDAVMFEMVYLS